MDNLMNRDTADRLIKNQYLHSNTENFVNIVNSHLHKLQNNQIDNSLLEQIKKKLENLIEQTNKQMNQFYKDINDFYGDAEQEGKVINRQDEYKNGEYHPYGANEFSRKFLINKEQSDQDATDEQIILSIINSIESRDAIKKAYDEVSKEIWGKQINSEFNDIQKNIITNMQKIFPNNEEKIKSKIDEMTYNDVLKTINNIFVQNRKRGTYGLKISDKLNERNKNQTKNNEKDELDTFLNSLGIQSFSARRKKDLQNLKNVLISQLINKNLYSRIGEKYWDEYLKIQFKKRTGKALPGGKKKKFIRYFSKIISRYNVNLIDVNQENTLNGFLLEFGLFTSSNLPLKYDQELVRILGQEQVVREYITEKYTSENQRENKTMKVEGQSPSDIEYIGKSGKVYKFQLKNSFNDISKALSFRSQAQIKVSTYLSTAFSRLDGNIKDILLYLLINTAFLRKYGLGPYNSNGVKDKKFTPTDYPVIRDYILFFLQQSYHFLLGYQYDKNIREAEGITAGNLAYIFKGEYLIPVAAYFYSALEMLNKVIDNKTELNGIGGISGLPSFKNVNISISNKAFQEEKINIIKEIKNNKDIRLERRYPQNLVNYGEGYGKKLYNNLSFERISITLIIEKLENYFKKVY